MGNSCHYSKSGRERFPTDQEVASYQLDFDDLVRQGSVFLKSRSGTPQSPPLPLTQVTEPLTPLTENTEFFPESSDSLVLPDTPETFTPDSLPALLPLTLTYSNQPWSPEPGHCGDSDAKSRVSCSDYPESRESSLYFSSVGGPSPSLSSQYSALSSPLSRVGRSTRWCRYPGEREESIRSFDKKKWVWETARPNTLCYTPVKVVHHGSGNIWATPVVEHPRSSPPSFPRLTSNHHI